MAPLRAGDSINCFLVVLMFLRAIPLALTGVSLEVTIAFVFPSSKSSLLIRLLSSSSLASFSVEFWFFASESLA
jgi:hypothetical protein